MHSPQRRYVPDVFFEHQPQKGFELTEVLLGPETACPFNSLDFPRAWERFYSESCVCPRASLTLSPDCLKETRPGLIDRVGHRMPSELSLKQTNKKSMKNKHKHDDLFPKYISFNQSSLKDMCQPEQLCALTPALCPEPLSVSASTFHASGPEVQMSLFCS